MNRAIVLLAAAAGVCSVLVARPASAVAPIDVEVGARVGGATNPIGSGYNILGFGVGGRAGVSASGVYSGLSGMYYFGGGPFSSWLLGFDGGYSFKFYLLTVRPVVGVGSYTIQSKVSPYSIQKMMVSTVNNFYVEPGLTALLGFGLVFIGADADVFLTPGLSGQTVSGLGGSNSKAAFMANGQVGVKF